MPCELLPQEWTNGVPTALGHKNHRYPVYPAQPTASSKLAKIQFEQSQMNIPTPISYGHSTGVMEKFIVSDLTEKYQDREYFGDEALKRVLVVANHPANTIAGLKQKALRGVQR